jgi:hypothetical protein
MALMKLSAFEDTELLADIDRNLVIGREQKPLARTGVDAD